MALGSEYLSIVSGHFELEKPLDVRKFFFLFLPLLPFFRPLLPRQRKLGLGSFRDGSSGFLFSVPPGLGTQSQHRADPQLPTAHRQLLQK